MKNIKTIYFVLLLILFLVLGVVIVLPEFIPSLEMIQVIVLSAIYLINIIIAYILVVRLWIYLQNVFNKSKSIILTTVVAAIVAFSLLISFIITSLGIGQGFMGGTFYKELKYPEHHLSLYLYNDSFLDPLTTVKIKNKALPIMKSYFYIENCSPAELKILSHNGILELSSPDILVRIDLKTRKFKKTNIPKE